MQNLGKLIKLRRASFADNELSRLEGLSQCVLLEELCLEENRILKLEVFSILHNLVVLYVHSQGLETLKFLRKLDLGKNKLCKLEGLSTLEHLTQVFFPDNPLVFVRFGLTPLHYACMHFFFSLVLKIMI